MGRSINFKIADINIAILKLFRYIIILMKGLNMQQINWYPGHMAKAKRAILKDLKLVDIIIELLDARIPFSSKNHDIDSWTNKPKIIILNKSDIACKKSTEIWKNYFSQKDSVILLNSKDRNGFSQITVVAEQIMHQKKENAKNRGRIFTPTRAIIVGIPNVGKSTFINSYVKKSITKVENKPGVTRSNQWIKINKSFELLDTPGMLPPKIENETAGINLAITGAIGYNTDKYTLAINLITTLVKRYPTLLCHRYKLENINIVADEILKQIAINRGLILKGNTIDIVRCCNMILEELRNNKIGRITLELPRDILIQRTKLISSDIN